MRITRIDMTGSNHHATIEEDDHDLVKVTIIHPDQPRQIFRIRKTIREMRDMAKMIQFYLDGCEGTASMVDDYYRELQRFAD